MTAIVDYFHGPHRLASEKLASSRLIRKEVRRGLIESHPANGTGHPSNTLWTNSIPVHHPDENEFFAALRAVGHKLVFHRALCQTDLSARFFKGSASLSYHGDHGAEYLLIVLSVFPHLAMQNPIPSTPCWNSGSMRTIAGAPTAEEFVACWAAGTGGRGPPSGRGRRFQLSS